MRTNTNRFVKRWIAPIAGTIAVLSLSGCTKAFCTNQDKANQLFGYYGNLYANQVVDTQTVLDDSTTELSYDAKKLNTHRSTLFSTLSEEKGLSSPDVAFLDFMDQKAKKFAEDNASLWKTGGALASSTSNGIAKEIAWHVGIYAGIKEENGKTVVGNLWQNFDAWYEEAVLDDSVGILKAPSAGWVATMKSVTATAINTNTACISPESKTFQQDGSSIYVEGKTWGQAFAEYGFLEGLFVYPFAYIIHAISTAFSNYEWAQILAIVVVTLMARIFTVISSVFQSRTQSKQAKIQPLLNELQKKYPNNATDREEKQAMAMEQARIMKKAKVHPLLPMLFMIIQFPLFICVWSALQGSAALAGGNWLGLSLTTKVSECFMNYPNTPGALTGIFIFIFMTIGNVLSSATSMFFTSWRTKNFGGAQPTRTDANGNVMDPNKTMKTISIVMMGFVVIMGWNLPAGMGIYWFLGAVISIFQTLLMEIFQTRNRHRLAAETGDGSTLAAIRRSKHHDKTKAEADRKGNKKSKSDKPLWR